SHCTRTDVTVCFCEADGNPSPELEWHLSGRPVTNSSNMFISEERLSSTGLRSSITLHQFHTHTSTLQCVSRNTHGTASQWFQLHLSGLQFAGKSLQVHHNIVNLFPIFQIVQQAEGGSPYIVDIVRQHDDEDDDECFCFQAQNEAAGTYASLQLSAPPSEYETLNIKRSDTQ
uniref:Ig-like domain-containing protein n=1 Tax=Cyprinus carpio TaxID=7962 RepID=A0A8C1ME85_CYPCA